MRCSLRSPRSRSHSDHAAVRGVIFGCVDPFVIDKRLLGTPEHLLCSGSFSWVSQVPHGAWHLDGTLKNDTDRCLDTLLKLNSIDLDVRPPQRFYRSMEVVMSGSAAWPPPWKDVMPRAAHRSFIESLIKRVAEALDRASTEYYNRVWVPGNAVFHSLQPAAINQQRFDELLAAGDGNLGALRTFQPGASGFAAPVLYNRFGSRTGRPTIASGPNILTLKREHRALLRSRWGSQGSIVLLDFKALEVRVILYEAGHRCDNPDLYADVNDSAFQGKLNRNVVKEAVICELYGQSKWVLGNKLGIRGKPLDAFVRRIQGHFKIEQLLQHVKKQFIATGYIINRYGRRVNIDEPLDHVLVNSYAQSTGADVVTLGFAKIIERLSGARAVPVFFLVDAILLDVHNDDLNQVKAIDSVAVDGYVQRWPLKFEEVSS